MSEHQPGRLRRRFVVRGVVQGVGFRPFVYVTASSLSLTGSVANDTRGVVIEVEGSPAAVTEFARRLRCDAPPLSTVESVDTFDVAAHGGTGFQILESSHRPGGRTLASPDIATCADCRRELNDPGNRRFRHPFITCTNCGPRFTIIKRLPYDRPATTMAEFPLCSRCAAEYADATDRRFHAQPIACPDCGPTLELVGEGRGEAALASARALIAAGAIVAVKGIGGYHLACDAGNDDAVSTLRRRKRRGDKPFAVMVRDTSTAARLTHLGAVESELLQGVRRPIVLLRRRTEHASTAPATVAGSVAPGSPDLGVLLPYSPLHELLLGLDGDIAGPEALVMTSGNLGGEPLVYDDEDALQRLAGIADAWLRHDRPIWVPCDDSVVRVVEGAELPLRRSRGYAPLPVALPFEVSATLAVGADLKNTCAVAEGRYAWLSQHIGDMDDLATVEAFSKAEQHLEELTGVTPTLLVADGHPAYRSSGWARTHRGTRPLRTVQHHHAHVASVMAEHGLDGSQPVVGFAFDGTGYGTDGAVWGGEVLLADYKGFERLAHLGYVWLPGGDAAVQRPYRMAMAHLAAAGVGWEADLPSVRACPSDERTVLEHQLTTGFGCVPTSSVGRLFDAVASLTDVRHVVDYEAQAAIEFEALALDAAPGATTYRFGLIDGEPGTPFVADPGPVIRAVVRDIRGGVPVGVVSSRFHAALVSLTVELAVRFGSTHGCATVALTGGVYQNIRLLSATVAALTEAGFTVLCHRSVPPNDGGLALGQILVGSTG